MNKKKISIIIAIVLIIAIIAVIFFVKTRNEQDTPNKKVSENGTPVEEFMEDTDWEAQKSALIEKSEHNWEISSDGQVECDHCEKSYKLGESFAYTPTTSGATIELSSELTGYTENQLVTEEEANWVVIGATSDGKGLSITTEIPLNQKDTIIFKGAKAYNNGIDVLNTVARVLYSNSEYGFARCMSVEDVNEYLEYENEVAVYTYLEEAEDNGEKAESWVTTDDLTTKIKDIPSFKSIVKNGTYTPDGKNTKEALGEYVVNGYTLQTSEKVENGKSIIRLFGTDEIFEVDAKKQNLIFGYFGNYYTYWLASRGVTVSEDFVAFGMSMIQDGSLTACVEMYDSRGESGLYYTDKLTPGIRPVVDLYVID